MICLSGALHADRPLLLAVARVHLLLLVEFLEFLLELLGLLVAHYSSQNLSADRAVCPASDLLLSACR